MQESLSKNKMVCLLFSQRMVRVDLVHHRNDISYIAVRLGLNLSGLCIFFTNLDVESRLRSAWSNGVDLAMMNHCLVYDSKGHCDECYFGAILDAPS